MYNVRYLVAKVLRKLLNPPAINHSETHKTARFDIGCCISSSTVGMYSYMGEYSSISMTKVGNFTSISSGCSIGGGSHPMDWVSMSPVFNMSGGLMRHKLANNRYESHEETVIGSDVWIGGDCLIKGGVTIGDGAVIGMGSVVTKNIGSYEVWVGNPARFVRYRFDEETRERLLELRWWDWNEEKLIRYGSLMTDPQKFLEQAEKDR